MGLPFCDLCTDMCTMDMDLISLINLFLALHFSFIDIESNTTYYWMLLWSYLFQTPSEGAGSKIKLLYEVKIGVKSHF